jgi:hypothetical protein
VAVVAVEGDTEKRDKSSRKYKGLQGERSHYSQDHIRGCKLGKDGERMGGFV